jgi:hypothetical protein
MKDKSPRRKVNPIKPHRGIENSIRLERITASNCNNNSTHEEKNGSQN